MQKKIFNNREKYSFNQSTKHNYIEPLKNLTRIRNCLQLFIRFASYETVSQSILTNRFVQKKIVFTHDSRFFFEKILKVSIDFTPMKKTWRYYRLCAISFYPVAFHGHGEKRWEALSSWSSRIAKIKRMQLIFERFSNSDLSEFFHSRWKVKKRKRKREKEEVINDK